MTGDKKTCGRCDDARPVDVQADPKKKGMEGFVHCKNLPEFIYLSPVCEKPCQLEEVERSIPEQLRIKRLR